VRAVADAEQREGLRAAAPLAAVMAPAVMMASLPVNITAGEKNYIFM
jgi:hypothetical protein